MKLVPMNVEIQNLMSFIAATPNPRILALFARMVPLLVMIMSHMKEVLQHVKVSLMAPNNSKLGLMCVDCMT